jgi:hypothetical protein
MAPIKEYVSPSKVWIVAVTYALFVLLALFFTPLVPSTPLGWLMLVVGGAPIGVIVYWVLHAPTLKPFGLRSFDPANVFQPNQFGRTVARSWLWRGLVLLGIAELLLLLSGLLSPLVRGNFHV